jgi:hypothetical protein
MVRSGAKGQVGHAGAFCSDAKNVCEHPLGILGLLQNVRRILPWQKPKRAWLRTRDAIIVTSLFVLVGVTLWFLYVAFFPEWVSK